MNNPFGTFYGGGQSNNTPSRPRQKNPQIGGGSKVLPRNRRLKKWCFCTPPGDSAFAGQGQQISCYQWRNCDTCCKSRFGEAWTGVDAIQGVYQRR